MIGDVAHHGHPRARAATTVDVGLAGRAELLDGLEGRAELGVVDPHRLDPHADADLVDAALLDEVHDREVGAVEEDEAAVYGISMPWP